MGAGKVVGIILGIIIVILAAGWFFMLKPSSIDPAVLYITEGVVEVDIGKGWVSATDEMILKQGAKVRTKNGKATVVFKEGEIMHLEPNTEIVLSEISSKSIKTTQVLGETWNTVTKLSGVAEYTVETPSTVATVRGTRFIMRDDEIAVGDGEVEARPKKDLKAMQKLRKGQIARVREAKMALAEAAPADTDMMSRKFARMHELDEKVLKKMRDRIIKKNERKVNVVKQRFNVKDEQIKEFMRESDEGRLNIDELSGKIPSAMRNKVVDRTIAISKIIQEKHREVEADVAAGILSKEPVRSVELVKMTLAEELEKSIAVVDRSVNESLAIVDKTVPVEPADVKSDAAVS